MRKLAASTLVLTALVAGYASLPQAVAQTATPDAARVQTQDRARQLRLPGERIDARLAYLKTALKITPTQEPQWNTFAGLLRRQAAQMDGEIQARRDTSAPKPTTAIERLEQRQKYMQTAAARMDEMLTAAKPLYASFTDDQKKVADEFLSRGGQRHGHHRSH
jgi:protein CpxP